MYKNYLLVAWRNLLKNKLYSLINILGLSVGLACCLLIALFVTDELNYDTFHEKADRIYRITRDFKAKDGSIDLHLGHVAPPFGHFLREEFSEIEEITRLLNVGVVFSHQEKSFNENNAFFAEGNFFKVFSVPVVKGNAQKALTEPFSVMVSEQMAKKYFGDEEPIGKLLKVTRGSGQFSIKVSGVFKELPRNSHFHPDFLVSFNTLNDTLIYGKERLMTNWGNNSFATYMVLPKGYQAQDISKRFPDFLDKYYGAFVKKVWKEAPADFKASQTTSLYLQKLTDIHLRSHLDSEIETNGDIRTVYIFSFVALFILLIAGINFVNLATARSANRAKEVGVRKVVGAVRGNLITQFLSESVLVTIISMLVALCLAELARPLLNSFTGKTLIFSYFTNPLLLLLMLSFGLVVGLLAGTYPAIYLSAFNPIQVLKGKLTSGAKSSSLRTVLVVVQFSISIILIISTGVVYQQLNYIQNKKLGLNKDHVVVMRYFGEEMRTHYPSFRQELLKNPAIEQVARSNNVPSDRLTNSSDAKVIQGDSLASTTKVIKNEFIDHDFITLYEMKLLAGRNFSRKYGTDDSLAYIINDFSAKMIGWKNPQQAIGQPFEYAGQKGKIIGVLEDFHYEALREPIVPLVFIIPRNQNYFSLSVKINGKNIQNGLEHLEKVWQKFLPDKPFEYKFLDQNFAELYQSETRQGQVLMAFALVAILIACLGLFGLASFLSEQRTKEIGIRKVLGASVSNLLGLMSKDFIRLIMIAIVVAFPSAYYLMSQWLQDFAYRTSMSIWLFVLAGMIALLISFLTIFSQILRIAKVNPVEVLKNE